MNNNVIEFDSYKVGRPPRLTTEEQVWVKKLHQLTPDDFEMIKQLITIMNKFKGNINNEVKLMRKAGLPDHFISLHMEIFKRAADKITLV